MNYKTTITALLVATTVCACGGYDTYVKSDDAALGRVVVYRNGIAYFERRARPTGNQLNITVPENKVNDFLKSLTVTDAKTGVTLPVSFPTRAKSSKGNVTMTIQLPNAKVRDVVLSYITEAPAWKSTYRVMVDKKGKVTLHGWAIVDNTSGEDWRAVKVGVGSSSALSFRYDLRSIRRVRRRMLRSKHLFAVAPPNGGPIAHTRVASNRVVMKFSDAHIPRPVGHPEREVALTTRNRGRTILDQLSVGAKASYATKSARSKANAHRRRHLAAAKRHWKRSQARAHSKVQALAKRLAETSEEVVIEGYAHAKERAPQDRAADRANTLRNALIKEGIAPARLRIAARGVVSGRHAGVHVVTKSGNRGKPSPHEEEAPVGESHFESSVPMTVAKGTSAMVSVVNKATTGQIVYLYDPDARRGNRRYAFKSLRFTNPTASSLDAGPVTVYGAGRFIGEGMSNAIPPKAKAIVAFAMDRQVRVDRSVTRRDAIAKVLGVKRGILRAQVRHARTTNYKAHNRGTTAATLFVRHNVKNGWRVDNAPKQFEKLGDGHLVKLKLKAGEQRVIRVVESTPLQRTVDLRSPIGVEMMRRHIALCQTKGEKGPFLHSLKTLVAEHSRIGQLHQAIGHLRQRNAEYRVRMDELHVQIVSLESVRSGRGLIKHLQKKMAEMSNAVQKTTIKLVNTEEQLMLSRIRFHDGISELTLPPKQLAKDNFATDKNASTGA